MAAISGGIRSHPIFLTVLLLVACEPGRVGEEPASDAPLSGRALQCAPDQSGWQDYPHLLGALHEHSGFSDGEIGTTPADYFAAGRGQGLDFMGASDHSDNLRLPVTANTDCLSADLPDCLQLPSADNPAGGFTKWEQMATMAEAASDESFTGFRGFEWTSDRFGHINVFFSQNELNAKTEAGYAVSMEVFWTWFTQAPPVGGADGLLVFNHPGREDAVHSNIPDPAYTFNQFAFREEAARRAIGVEVFGKSSDAYDTDNNAPPEGWYAFALDQGWSLGPVGAEDEHGTSWGQPDRAKTVLIAADRSPAALREALLARRLYALAQHHNAIRLNFTADAQPMGARLSRADGQMVELRGAVTAGLPEGARLELVSNGGELIAESAGGALQQQVSADPTERWYYLRLRDAEGAPIAYSSPVWIVAGDYPACD